MASVTQRKVKEELEDTSTLLKKDVEPLREVNETAWWIFDAICGFGVTYFTHGVDDMSVLSRLLAMAFILVVAFCLQRVYFTAGLDRPASGQAKIDKWWHMAIVHFANTLFFWQWMVMLYRMVQGWIDTKTHPVVALATFGIGFFLVILCCDIIAGFVHWFGDTTDMYFFQYHHVDSRYMTRQSYVHHTWETFALALFLSLFVPGFNDTVFLTSMRIIACQGNECHMWSHCTSREIPPFIKLMQDLTLVLSWKAHMHHHKPPHLIDYCVFNGWANPIMNVLLPGPATNALLRFRDSAFFQWVKKTLDT